ncbi:MAG: glycerate kinase [Alphaproteobacteria bacterium]|nr:glycerate kinase [Alphaproteobacteria bacterium]
MVSQIYAASLRQIAESLFRAGIEAADPGKAVTRVLQIRDGQLHILGDDGDPANSRSAPWRRIFVVAFGKAALAMAEATRDALPTNLFHGPGVAVTNYANARNADGFTVIAAGHPLPDTNGVKGAQVIVETIGSAGENDLVLVLISGGGSALIPYPAPGLVLEDKIATTNLLLRNGANIGAMNTVRKHLSGIKGGGLSRFTVPADLHALILSDVLGDDLSTIASGPTVPDVTTFADAKRILETIDAWDKAPKPVRSYIEKGVTGEVKETPKPGDPLFATTANTLVGSNGVSLAAFSEAAYSAGCEVQMWDSHLTGEAHEEAEKWATAALTVHRETPDIPLAMVAGGETTVTLKGAGQGGRNQEMALAFALAAEKTGLSGDWVFLSGGTDGHDGPTDAAGGVMDRESCVRMREAGVDPQAFLVDNNSHAALEASGDLLVTGATGTNVADLQVFLLS